MRGVKPGTYELTLPGPMLRRGFWLYVWRVETPKGEMLYVGRTGDNSSPNATAPYSRMGQHLGKIKNQNALRQHLLREKVDPEKCSIFHLIAHGPLYPEVEKATGASRDSLMVLHKPIRNIVGAMEKALAEELSAAGYTVLNEVKWRHPIDAAIWSVVRAAFAIHFPRLARNTSGKRASDG